jgi:hypothetical protein
MPKSALQPVGVKHDAGKPKVGLIMGGFAPAILEVAKVGTFGAAKYGPGNWREVADGQARYTDAMLRHWLAAQHEFNDPETGLPHLAHVAWNALAVLTIESETRDA